MRSASARSQPAASKTAAVNRRRPSARMFMAVLVLWRWGSVRCTTREGFGRRTPARRASEGYGFSPRWRVGLVSGYFLLAISLDRRDDTSRDREGAVGGRSLTVAARTSHSGEAGGFRVRLDPGGNHDDVRARAVGPRPGAVRPGPPGRPGRQTSADRHG